MVDRNESQTAFAVLFLKFCRKPRVEDKREDDVTLQI